MFNFLKKKTREEQVLKRAENVLTVLLSTTEFEFTDLENVQIMNSVRRQLAEHLKHKKALNMELSVNHNQTALEITNAIKLIE